MDSMGGKAGKGMPRGCGAAEGMVIAARLPTPDSARQTASHNPTVPDRTTSEIGATAFADAPDKMGLDKMGLREGWDGVDLFATDGMTNCGKDWLLISLSPLRKPNSGKALFRPLVRDRIQRRA
jgi:hypothetical protein